jgi:hypothetical protein
MRRALVMVLVLGCQAAVPDTEPEAIAASRAGCDEPTSPADCRDHGVPTDSGWFERAFVVALNGARAAPRGFRDRYLDVGDDSLARVFDSDPSPRAPYLWNPAIADAARLHAEDRMGCWGSDADPHGLCDGTSFWTWTKPWRPPVITAGVAHPWVRDSERRLPLWFAASFLCDGQLRSDGKLFGCVSDADEAAGHRKILVLTPGETQLGVAFATGPSRGFLSGETSRDAADHAYPIVTAGHFFAGDELVFAANVETDAPPLAVTLVLGDGRRAITPLLGTATRGLYGRAQSPGTGCQSYHFELVDAAGVGWRYPARGSFRTFGQAGCTEDWIP